MIFIIMFIICFVCLMVVGLKYVFDIDMFSVVGLIVGVLISMFGLVVVIDSINLLLVFIVYGIVYLFGVIGVILFVKLLFKIMWVDLDKEVCRLELEWCSGFLELIICIFRVIN